MGSEIFPKVGNAQIDELNSTTTPLGISGIFTGTAVDVSGFVAAQVQVFADEDSATDGLSLQTSDDGTNWDHIHAYDYVSDGAGSAKHYDFALPAQYFRVVYTNGTTAQTTFRMQTKLLRVPAQNHAHPIEDSIAADHPAPIVKSVLAGRDGAGDIVNIARITTAGLLKAQVEQSAHDNLNANANIQVANADASESNPVPTTPVNENFLTLIEPSLTASISMVPGEFIHKFEVPNAFTRNGGSGIVQQMTVINTQNNAFIDMMLWFYGDNPTITSASGANYDLSDTEAKKLLFKAPIRSGSYDASASNSAAQAGQQGILVANKESTPGTSLWVVVTSLSTFTTATDQFSYRIGIVQT